MPGTAGAIGASTVQDTMRLAIRSSAFEESQLILGMRHSSAYCFDIPLFDSLFSNSLPVAPINLPYRVVHISVSRDSSYHIEEIELTK